MEFKDALNIISSVVNLPVAVEYDGIIVKKLTASNTLDDNRTTKQTHIAITGKQMDIFPVLSAEQYFNCDYAQKNDSFKKYLYLKIPLKLYKENVDKLGENTIFEGVETPEITVHSSLVKSRRRNEGDQIQLSLTTNDDEKFIQFRKLLHEGDYLIICKHSGMLLYDCFGVQETDLVDRLLNSDGGNKLNNDFFYAKTSTPVVLDQKNLVKIGGNSTKVHGANNRLFYGVPGCGKSFTVDKMVKDDGFDKNIRVVFHPDYTYYDFVGQIAPRVELEGDSSKVKYVFTPGPFTQILKHACDHPDQKCLLIIEELNRGNAPAIFGELFQLLDRSEERENLGESKYGVTNYDIAEYVYGDREHEVKISSNLSIFATMNTSDQNVFTLDTAFQRRWFMNHIPNKFEGKHAAHIITGTDISWGAFATVVNNLLHEEMGGFCSTEDKSLGAYFATDSDLESGERFSEKVLKYLWDDAFKMSREALFNNNCRCLGDVIESFQKQGGLKAVLQDNVYKNMVEGNADFSEEDVEAPRGE